MKEEVNRMEMGKRGLNKSHNANMLSTFYDLNSSCGCGLCTCAGCVAGLNYGSTTAAFESSYRSGLGSHT
jgi:hypothetical protein